MYHSQKDELEKWKALAQTLGAVPFSGVVEANLIRNDCKVIHFINPSRPSSSPVGHV